MKKKNLKWSVTTRLVSDLTNNGYNPRKISDNEKKELQKSITEFGAVAPIILNTGSRENIIIGGEQRVHIYADLGYTEVECMIPSRELSMDEEKELNLRLNHNKGSWSEELLKDFEMDMLLGVGFGDEELQNLFDDVELYEDDFDVIKAVEKTITPTVQTGEIWQLGQNRLLVGDSTELGLVQKMMDGDTADIIWQDFPYNIGLSYSKGTGGNASYQGSFTKKDDSKSEADYLNFLNKSTEVAKAIAKDNCHYFYWSDPSNIWMMQTLYKQHGITNRRVCFWVKNSQNPTYKIAFNRLYEPTCYGTTGKPYLNSSMNSTNEILNQEVTTGNLVHDELLDMIDIWIEKRDDVNSYLHPTQKPVTLNEKPFKRCSAPGHIIFSGFAGSGSDLIACETLNRKWRGVEQDPIFATIIIKRWEEFTGNKAKRIHESN
jgi:DNA modification methylase